jgi:hypothetical protein
MIPPRRGRREVRTSDSPAEPDVGGERVAETAGRGQWTVDRGLGWSTPPADDGSWSLILDSFLFGWYGLLGGRRTQMTLKVAATDAYSNRSATRSYTCTVHIR